MTMKASDVQSGDYSHQSVPAKKSPTEAGYLAKAVYAGVAAFVTTTDGNHSRQSPLQLAGADEANPVSSNLL
ncbi:MAG: hypothetical protein L3J88_00385 [Gammaproteobacteria bacterium]|nr:hypothetical protein [Gammaproteobacteria bacterium]MCF6361830.1 hypothetical protein [Gammaproteobacteria bacterium]